MRNLLSQYQGIFNLEVIQKEVQKCFPFDKFFEGQEEAIIHCVDAFMNRGAKHVILEAPTGVGKTLIAYTIHRVISKLTTSQRFRTTVTTTTKGLQAQYEKDTHAYDLKGKKNYQCPYGQEYYSTMGCKDMCAKKLCAPRSMCPYVKRRMNWTINSDWRVTNTAMFIEMCPILCMELENKADLVVLDECHKISDTLLDHMEIAFDPEQLQPVNLFYGYVSDIYTLAVKIRDRLSTVFAKDYGKLISFPEDIVPTVDVLNERLNQFLQMIDSQMKTEETSEQVKELCWRVIERCQDWSDACEIITDCGVREFIVKELNREKVTLKPVYPAHVSEYGVFRKADYFLHMSATICGLEAYADLLGLDKRDYVTISMKHPIPIKNRPVKYIPVTRMTGKIDENKLSSMIRAIEELADIHPGENGLVHTASYKLAEDLMARSKYKGRMMIGRDRRQTMEILRLNATTKGGVIVLSPSMTTGYDLVGDLCRWNVVAKVPFGFLGDPLIKYISEKSPGGYIRDTVLSVVQAAGRCVRGVDDHGTTYVLDEAFDMVLSKGAKYIPSWFTDAIEGY